MTNREIKETLEEYDLMKETYLETLTLLNKQKI